MAKLSSSDGAEREPLLAQDRAVADHGGEHANPTMVPVQEATDEVIEGEERKLHK